MGIENIDVIGESLKINITLTKLNLYYNQIENIDKLTEALKINTTLMNLNYKVLE